MLGFFWGVDIFMNVLEIKNNTQAPTSIQSLCATLCWCHLAAVTASRINFFTHSFLQHFSKMFLDILTLCWGLLPCWKMNHHPSVRSRAPEQVFTQDVPLHSWMYLSLFPDCPPSFCCWKTSHSMTLAWPGFVHQTRSSCFSWSESPSGAFLQSVGRLLCAVHSEGASALPRYHPGLKDGLRQTMLSSWKVLHSPEVWSSDSMTNGSWSSPWLMSFSFPIPQFSWPASFKKSPGGPYLHSLTDDGGHRAHWGLQSSRTFPLPFHRQFIWLHAWFVLWLARPYISRCVLSKSCPIKWIYHSEAAQTSQGRSLQAAFNFELCGKMLWIFKCIWFFFLINWNCCHGLLTKFVLGLCEILERCKYLQQLLWVLQLFIWF